MPHVARRIFTLVAVAPTAGSSASAHRRGSRGSRARMFRGGVPHWTLGQFVEVCDLCFREIRARYSSSWARVWQFILQCVRVAADVRLGFIFRVFDTEGVGVLTHRALVAMVRLCERGNEVWNVHRTTTPCPVRCAHSLSTTSIARGHLSKRNRGVCDRARAPMHQRQARRWRKRLWSRPPPRQRRRL